MSQNKTEVDQDLDGDISHRIPEEIIKIKIDKKNLKCPFWLDREAKKKFKELSKKFYEYGLLTNLDVEILMLYCKAFSKYKKAELLLDDQELTVMGRNGIKLNPLINASQVFYIRMKNCIEKMGLSPIDRRRLGIETTFKEDDEYDETGKYCTK